jgi:hypothetical protein
MRFRLLTAAVAAALICSCGAFAQMGTGGGRGPGPRGLGFRSGKVVPGEPYSATVTNTTVRTLADGNIIQRTTTGTVARDAQGRTSSTETITGMFGQAGTKTITFLSDPVAGYVYTLSAETKTAMRRAMHTANSSGMRAERESKPADPNVVTADKGTQTINGVSAEGKLVTHTIPAGQMGNEKPIVSTSEIWYSPELQVVISSTRIDPREGKSTFALTDIKRTEPATDLFQVPSDYTIKDAPSFGGHR